MFIEFTDLEDGKRICIRNDDILAFKEYCWEGKSGTEIFMKQTIKSVGSVSRPFIFLVKEKMDDVMGSL